MVSTDDDTEMLHEFARRLGRTVVVEPFGVYLESRSGADDERIGRTIKDARSAMERRWLRHRTSQAVRSSRPN